MKKTLPIKKFLLVIGIAIFVIGFFIFLKRQGSIIYYYGQDCPHCQNVENYLKNNKGY